MSCSSRLVVLIVLALCAWNARALFAAPENPEGMYVVLGTSCVNDTPMPLAEWFEISNSSGNLGADMVATICLPEADQTGSVLFEYEMTESGSATGQSYPNYGEVYMGARINTSSGTMSVDIYDGTAGHLSGSATAETVRIRIATGPTSYPSAWTYVTSGYLRAVYSDGAQLGGNYIALEIPDPLYWTGSEIVRLRVVDWDVYNPDATPTPTQTPHPQATATPPPTDPCAGVVCPALESCVNGICVKPDQGVRVNAVPDGCDGIEVLPFEWGLVLVGGSWTRSVPNNYSTGYTVRWTFRAEVGRSFSANVNTNGYLMGLSWSGPSSGEDMYYEVTWPSTFTDNPASLLAANTGSNAIMIASICIQPKRTTSQCLNDDAEFDNPSVWSIGYPAYINNGALNLRPGGWAQQQQYLSPGRYRIQLQAQALPSGTSQSMDLYVGSDLYRTIIVPAGDVPTHYWYDFDLVNGAPILTMLMPINAPTDAVVRIQYVCISLLASATPTPTPAPTPTAVPPPQSCDNAGYDFSLPDLWTLNGSEIVVMDNGDHALLLFKDSSAYQTLNIPQGQYAVTIRAVRGVSGNAPAGFGVTFGYTTIGEWVIHPDVPINEMLEFMGMTYLDGGQHLLEIYALPGYFGGRIYSVCLSYLGNPNPQPTPTPGATPTPPSTPWPDPVYCVNPDSGLDTTDVWVVIGSGYIAGSQAQVEPGDQLAADVIVDTQTDYDVTISGYCTANSTANVYWRNQMQTLLCTAMPFKRTFYFPAEPALFVSSPLVDLLEPQISRGIMPGDLPSGFAPQLFRSPLGVPQPDTASPLLSPLSIPEFPEGEVMDALMMMLSSIMQIQASTGNSAPIIITSVCVQDRAWVPPAEPPEIKLYHPVCERDWAIKQDYSGISPVMLVGLGAQAGMPVHAMYGGTVVDARLDSGYTFAGVRYDGCVTIDHTNALGVGLQSIVCNLDTFAVSAGGAVVRGQLLGYTSDRSNYGILGPGGVGLALVGIYYGESWVNPIGYFQGFVDCHPYRVIIEEIERCAADDGSGIIPPRYNMPAPSIWEPGQWVPWLARRLYDTVGYPILCALIPVINVILTTIQDIANAIISVLTAPLLFLYRVGRIFEYMLGLFGRVLTAIWALFDDMARLAVCFRSIIAYFISAMTSARDAERPALELAPGPLLYAINLALLLISSTVANALLIPMVGLLIAYASWKLVPWGIKNIREAIGAGS